MTTVLLLVVAMILAVVCYPLLKYCAQIIAELYCFFMFCSGMNQRRAPSKVERQKVEDTFPSELDPP